MSSDLLNFAKSGRSDLASSSTQSRGFADMSLSVAKRLGIVAVMAFAVGACSQQSSAAPQAQSSVQGTAQASVPSSPQPLGTLNGRTLPDFATLVEQVGPAVVNIQVLEKAHRVRNNTSDDSGADDPFQEFFRRFGIPAPDQAMVTAAMAADGSSRSRSARVRARVSSSAPTATSSPMRTSSPTLTR